VELRKEAMSYKPTVFAIDFGTSNSLLAAACRERTFEPIPLDLHASDPTIFRTALYFASLNEAVFGARATQALVDNGFRGRLIRSIKRHLPSRSFSATRIGEQTVSLEQLIGAFLQAMRERACTHFDVDVRRVVLGRPARFSNRPEEDQLAEARLRKAAQLAGFEDISFCPEPVAAAYDFAADLDEPRTVLIADLGGGTSDFTLVRMTREGFQQRDVLAVHGVATAGDAIDGSLVRASVAPEFGGQTRYMVPMGSNVLPMPADLIEILCSPADLTLVDRGTVLRRIADISAGAVDRADCKKLDKLYAVVEDGVGFQLYEAVEGTKRALSSAESAELSLDYPGADLDLTVTRVTLEQAAAQPLNRILGALDDTLTLAQLRPQDIDIVCLTGGTSLMPLTERAIRERLPAAALRRLKSLHSVVSGLARHAQTLA
jgi:hypothetical chaperone protein